MVKINKFEGHNFRLLRIQIEYYFYQKKLLKLLVEKKPEMWKHEDWNILDRQDLGMVRLSLENNVAYNIVNDNTT